MQVLCYDVIVYIEFHCHKWGYKHVHLLCEYCQCKLFNTDTQLPFTYLHIIFHFLFSLGIETCFDKNATN